MRRWKFFGGVSSFAATKTSGKLRSAGNNFGTGSACRKRVLGPVHAGEGKQITTYMLDTIKESSLDASPRRSGGVHGVAEGKTIDDGQLVQVKREEVGVRWLALAPKTAWRERTVPFRQADDRMSRVDGDPPGIVC